MTLRVERSARHGFTVFALSGRIEAEHIAGLKELFELGLNHQRVILDLIDLKLVDREGVRLLIRCEADGMKLEHCPAYVREWMEREKDSTMYSASHGASAGDRVATNREVFEALPKAFLPALLLTGGIEAAEAAVLDAIAAFEFDYSPGGTLLLETVKSAIRRRSDSRDQSEQAFSILPLELRRLLLLAQDSRNCFVLRVLLGMTPEISSGILNRSVHEVEEALHAGLQTCQRLKMEGGPGLSA
jgi:DNA-directed RNA polymerase specialized sigma24 family protein